MLVVAVSSLGTTHLQKYKGIFNIHISFFDVRYTIFTVPFCIFHPYSAGEGRSGLGTLSLFHTIAWYCARIMASFRAAWVGGSLSDSACFLRKRNHLRSFTLKICVFGRYRRQTSFSIAAKVSGVGCGVEPRPASAVAHS